MDSIELSIVIPVYNVEKYLSDTIESVRNQTYKQWELILVDDGSSDLTPSICERYAEVDSRIKFVHIKNSGPGKARNIGIELAKGTYIAFVDGDINTFENFILTEALFEVNYVYHSSSSSFP